MFTFTAWNNFYIIVGSSAGALTGLTFVVATLMQGRQPQGLNRAVAAYTTPTIVHLGAALLVCAALSAPWLALTPVALLLELTGLAGIVYMGIIVRRSRRVEIYEPVVADWVWRGILPLVAYGALVVAAPMLRPGSATLALFGVGAAVLLLLFIGIHNAWDEVTFIAVELPQRSGGHPVGQQAGRAED